MDRGFNLGKTQGLFMKIRPEGVCSFLGRRSRDGRLEMALGTGSGRRPAGAARWRGGAMAAALELAGVSHSHDSVYQKPSRGHGKEEQPANSPSVFGRAEREREARVATGEECGLRRDPVCNQTAARAWKKRLGREKRCGARLMAFIGIGKIKSLPNRDFFP